MSSKRIGISGCLAENGKALDPATLASDISCTWLEFDDGTYEQDGHIQVDLGLDAPFLQEGVAAYRRGRTRVRTNVPKLVDFTNQIEKNSGASARLLWSESEENLAQKLIARLQKVQ